MAKFCRRPAIDRSKLRNPDLKPGETMPKIEFILEDGMVYGSDGKVYKFAGIFYNLFLEDPERNYEPYQETIFTSDSDEDINRIISSNETKKKKKKIRSIIKEPDDHGNKKKEHKNFSDFDSISVKREIPDWDEKKQKRRTKRERSGSPSRNRKHHSPHRHRSRTPSPEHKDHRHRSRTPSPEHKAYRHRSRTPSPNRRYKSTSPNHHHDSPRARHDKIVAYSPSPSPSPEENFEDVKVKTEPEEKVKTVHIADHIFGCYECEVCNITLTSFQTFNAHNNGKKHRKNMKMKLEAGVSARITPNPAVPESQSKYPKVAVGCIRRKVSKKSVIQDYVETAVLKPCPGLNLVIEIQAIGCTSYYCSLCDSACSSDSIIPHLNGFKHQLHLLKHYKAGAYEKMQYEPKYKIENEIRDILYAIQKKEGRGRITVEIEELASKDSSLDVNQPSTSKQSQPSTSYRSQPSTSRDTDSRYDRALRDIPDLFEAAAIPEARSSDFVCHVCQSHMNSYDMWISHINGKRHLKNVKKIPGDQPSKAKTVALPNKRAHLLDLIKKELPNEPVIGLREIRETEIVETNSYQYQCFMCRSVHANNDILGHIISLKHRTNYLEHIQFEGREVTYSMSDTIASDLIRDMCAQVQKREGSGKPEVHVNKSSLYR